MTPTMLILLFAALAHFVVSEQHLIEDRRYEEARDRLQEVADQYWFTPTRYLELRSQIQLLEERIAERDGIGPR